MLCFSLLPGDVYNDFCRHRLIFGAYSVLSSHLSREWSIWTLLFPTLRWWELLRCRFWAVLEICWPYVSADPTVPPPRPSPDGPREGWTVYGGREYAQPHILGQLAKGMPWEGMGFILSPTILKALLLRQQQWGAKTLTWSQTFVGSDPHPTRRLVVWS